MPDNHRSASTGPSSAVRGIVTMVVFKNPRNGFTVARVAPGRTSEGQGKVPLQGTVSVVGKMPGLREGLVLDARGAWVRHPRHGPQFRVTAGEFALRAADGDEPDVDSDIVLAYLGSRLITGVGSRTAMKIVATFGPDVVSVIEDTPARLAEVRGIGQDTAGRIAARWREDGHVRAMMLAVQRLGRPPGLAVKIFERYGDAAVQLLATDAERVIREAETAVSAHAERIAGYRERGRGGSARVA